MKRMLEVMDNTKGIKSELLESIIKDEGFDLRYEDELDDTKYYRLRADRKDVKRLKNYLVNLGYCTIIDNRFFWVFE